LFKRGEIIQRKIKGIQIGGEAPRRVLLDHVVIDANGLITWEIVGSYVIDVNGLV
jgi:hypothetical protein